MKKLILAILICFAFGSCKSYMGMYAVVGKVELERVHTPQSKYITDYKCLTENDWIIYITDTVNRYWPGDTVWFTKNARKR